MQTGFVASQPEILSALVMAKPEKAGIAHLLSGQALSEDDRSFAERLLAEALSAWHKEIGKDNPVLGALREQLAEQHERISRLELAGLFFRKSTTTKINTHPASCSPREWGARFDRPTG